MKKRILFVDNLRDDFDKFSKLLEAEGIIAFYAKNGDSAVQLLQEQNFDLVVLELMFYPGGSLVNNTNAYHAGITLLRMIRDGNIERLKTDPNVPAVILTALSTNEESDKQLKELGIIELLGKPTNISHAVELFTRSVMM